MVKDINKLLTYCHHHNDLIFSKRSPYGVSETDRSDRIELLSLSFESSALHSDCDESGNSEIEANLPELSLLQPTSNNDILLLHHHIVAQNLQNHQAQYHV